MQTLQKATGWLAPSIAHLENLALLPVPSSQASKREQKNEDLAQHLR
jgi:hypothetical protein